MCLITMGTLGAALGMSSAAVASATAASATGVSMLGVLTGLANAALGVSALGGVVSGVTGGVSAYQGGKAQQAQMNYQAKVAQNNARIAQANADQERQEGIEESRLQRIRNLQKIGAQQSAIAANGVDISSGTALDMIEDTAAMGELDALTTRYNSETKAIAYEEQANNYSNQANLDMMAGQNAYRSGLISAAGEGMKGLASGLSVAADWYSPNSVSGSGKKSNSWKRNTGTLSGLGVREFMGNYT